MPHPRSWGGGRGSPAERGRPLHLLQEVSGAVCVSVHWSSSTGPDGTLQTIPQRVQLQDPLRISTQVSESRFSFSSISLCFPPSLSHTLTPLPPRVSTGSSGTKLSLTLRKETTPDTSLSREDLTTTCVLLCTADYCLDTTSQVALSLTLSHLTLFPSFSI